MINKSLFVFFVGLVPVLFSQSLQIDSILKTATPFTVEKIAEELNDQFEIKELLPYLELKNSLLLKIIRETVILSDSYFDLFPTLNQYSNSIQFQYLVSLKDFIKKNEDTEFSYELLENLTNTDEIMIKATLCDLFQYCPEQEAIEWLKLIINENMNQKLWLKYAVNSLIQLQYFNLHDFPGLINSKDPYIQFLIEKKNKLD